jgi:PAS domain S-box-containing protein
MKSVQENTMKIIHKILTVIFVINLLSVPMYAGGGQQAARPAIPVGDRYLRFDRLSVEDGLPHTSVYDILQDRQGFMWFATDDGVCRYDGYTFTTFKPIPDNPKTINPGAGYALYEDRSGNIWIGIRNGGLNRYNPITGTFTRYEHDPNNPNSLSHNSISYDCIYEDSTGIFWIGTWNGLNRFDPMKQTFKRYYHDAADPDSLSKSFIRTIEPDPADDKILWIGTNDGGLNRFDRISENFVRYQHDETNPDSIGHHTVWKIYGEVSQEGKTILWVCTAGGMDRFDTASGKFTHFRHDPLNPDSLSNNEVYSVVPVGDNTFWVGTHSGGLNRFDPVRKTFVSYRSSKNSQTVSSNIIHPLCYDRNGTLWIGTWGGGLSRIDPLNQKTRLYDEDSGLSYSAVLSLYEDRNGIIWIGTWSGGLNRFDPETGTFEHFRHDPKNPDSLGNDIVGWLYEDSQGVLWVGTWGGGLNRFDRETKRFKRYVYEPDNPQSLSHNAVRTICEDSAGNLWVGTTNGGLNRFDRARQTFTRYQYDSDNPYSVSTNNIWAVLKDSSGILWITTTAGLNRFDPAAERFIQYHHDENDLFSISSDAVINIYEDSRKMLWITTQFGLNRFDKVTGRFTRYFEEHGLPDNRIESICEDNDGNLWLGTGKGLCRFNPETNKITTYGIGDGMQGNLFFYPAAMKSRTGELWFGGPKGLNVIDPEKITDNPHKPAVVLTDFQIDGKSVHAGEHSVLKEDISMVREIMITPDISKFGFEFSALNYTVSEKNRYAYKMEGFDKDWVNTGSDRRFAHYTNLDPGRYIFRVKGSNNDGVWNEQGASVKIIILPPWWKTWWFRISSAGWLLMLFFGLHRWRLYAVRQRNILLEETVAERTEELRESEEQFRKMFENHHAVMLLIDSEAGSIIRANRSARKYYGYSAEEFETLAIFHINQFSREEIISEMADALEEKCNCFNFRHRIADGSSRDVEVHSSPIPFKGRTILFSVIHDITERKRAEESLKKSEALLKDMGRIAKIGGWEFDVETRKQVWTDEVYRIHEIDADFEPTVEKGLEFYTPESGAVIAQAVRRTIEHGEAFDLELPFITAKGKHLWVHAVGRAYQVSGKTVKVGGIIQDITAGKQAEEALRRNERLMSDIIDFLPDATFVIDRQGKVLAWNKSMEIMTGIKAEEILGKGDYEYAMPFYGKRRPILIDLVLQPKEDIEKTYCQIQRAGDKMTAEHYYPNLQGKQTWLFGNASVLRNSEGDIIGAIESVRDITDRKLAEIELKKAKEAAEAAERVKNTFLANVSHHLRTPLNSVLGFSEIMAEDKNLPRQYQEYIAMIRRSGKDLLAIINQMLEVSKIDAESLGSDPRYHHLLNLLASSAVHALSSEEERHFSETEFAALRADIQRLPAGLAAELARAVKNLDIREILAIIGHIRLENPAAAEALAYLANRFEYEEILRMLAGFEVRG